MEKEFKKLPKKVRMERLRQSVISLERIILQVRALRAGLQAAQDASAAKEG